MNDLVSILALPAVWSDGEPARILQTFLDALLVMLDLDFLYARTQLAPNATQIDELRTAQLYEMSHNQEGIRNTLNHWFGKDPQQLPEEGSRQLGGQEISVVPIRLGIDGEAGLIVAGSQRAGFPEQTERLILNVAANQVAIGLQQAFLLNEQKRVARELDQRVAERTKQIAEINEELQLQVGLLQNLPVSAWTLKPDGTPDFVNQVWLDYSGQTLDFVRSHPEAWMTAFHPDDREAAAKTFWEGIRSGQGFAMETRSLRAQDGVYRWHINHAVVLHDVDGKVLKFVGATTDIDDRKHAEEALRASERNLIQIINTMPVLAWSTLPDGTVEFLNQRWLDFTGLSPEQTAGWGWTVAVHPDDTMRLVEAWQGALASGRGVDVEARLRQFDGQYRWFLFRGDPMRDKAGAIVKWYGTNTDIDDRKRAEQELHNTQAELAKMMRVMTIGQLTASIAHEVSQPLSGIITNASTCLRMLSNNPPDVDGALETAKRTLRDGNRATDVITRLRTLFSKKQINIEPVDVNEAAREVLALLSGELQKRDLLLLQQFSSDLPQVMGDRVQLQQVILNLLRNGLDAMETVIDRPRRLLIRTKTDTNCVLVSVEDSGVGFDLEIPDRLFESFFTTKQEGMGIGLSVSRSIVEAHHGKLWAIKNDGPGATFAFSIPCEGALTGTSHN